MPNPLTPEQSAAKIAELEATVKKLDSRVQKLERAHEDAQRAASRLGRF